LKYPIRDITQTHISFFNFQTLAATAQTVRKERGGSYTISRPRAAAHAGNHGQSVNKTIRYKAERHTRVAAMLSFRFPFLP
jgi:hypothetical protein